MVQTKNGLIADSELQVIDHIQEDEKARYIATEWYHNGELVRRDAWVNLKQGLSMEGAQNNG